MPPSGSDASPPADDSGDSVAPTGAERAVDGPPDSELDRWSQLEGLFEHAVTLGGVDRQLLIQELTAVDPELATELESLLEHADSASGFFDRLEHSVFSGESESGNVAAAAIEALDPLLGKRVRQYEIRRRIGAGGMGIVYEAFDAVLVRPVALKFMPTHLSTDAKARDLFYIEARAAASLEHENICAIHEVGETDEGRLFIAMSYYEGRTLRDRLKEGPFPIAEALDCARQACAGLARAHAAGVIHRDVSPGNLFLTEDGTIKLLDFGLAKVGDATLTGTRKAMGTIGYMAPEQLRGERSDARADIWSLATVAYELLTGEGPFAAKSTAAIVDAVLNREPQPPTRLRPEIPERAERAILHALTKSPDGRPRTAAAFAAELLGETGGAGAPA